MHDSTVAAPNAKARDIEGEQRLLQTRRVNPLQDVRDQANEKPHTATPHRLVKTSCFTEPALPCWLSRRMHSQNVLGQGRTDDLLPGAQCIHGERPIQRRADARYTAHPSVVCVVPCKRLLLQELLQDSCSLTPEGMPNQVHLHSGEWGVSRLVSVTEAEECRKRTGFRSLHAGRSACSRGP